MKNQPRKRKPWMSKSNSNLRRIVPILVILSGMILSACNGAATPELLASPNIPAVETVPNPTLTPLSPTILSPAETLVPAGTATLIPTDTAVPFTEDTPEQQFDRPVPPMDQVPTPVAGEPALAASTAVKVRSGPGIEYPSYGYLILGQTAQVVGKSSDGSWLAIKLPFVPLRRGWVSQEFVELTDADKLSVIEPPPIPPPVGFPEPPLDEPYIKFLSTVYIHSGPGEQYPALGIAPEGKRVRVVGREEGDQWWAIYVNSKDVPSHVAWVSAAYAEDHNTRQLSVVKAPSEPLSIDLPVPAESAPLGIAMAAVKLRSGPGAEYPVLAVAPSEATLEITGASQNGEWWQVKVPDSISPDGLAWVQMRFIQAEGAQSVPIGAAPALPLMIKAITPQPANPQVLSQDPVLVRAGPGNDWPVIGLLPAGTSMLVLGISPDSQWYVVKLPVQVTPTGQGWVRAMDVSADKIGNVPVIPPPPKP